MLQSIVCDPRRFSLSPSTRDFCSEEMINLFQVLTGGLMDAFQVCDLPVYTSVPTVTKQVRLPNLQNTLTPASVLLKCFPKTFS